jgi:hypothetical protein
MDRKSVKLLIVLLIIILSSGTIHASVYHTSSPGLHEINETNVLSNRTVPYSSWQGSPAKTIILLSKLNEESLTNCTNPESPIYDPNVLKAYGKIPAIKNATQLAEFSSKLETVKNNSIYQIKPYLYPNGPIVDYGSGYMPGYFLIKFYDYEGNKTVYSETEFKEIYNIVKKYALKAGIDQVPVIFSLWDKTAIFYFPENNSTLGGDVIQITDIKNPIFHYNVSNASSLKDIKNDSLNSSNINNSNGNKSDDKRLAPGFGLLGSLICLYGGWNLRKK